MRSINIFDRYLRYILYAKHIFFCSIKLYVNIQGFQYRQSPFVAKQVTISKGEKKMADLLLAPPVRFEHLSADYQWQCRWLQRRLHGLAWEEGEIPYAAAGRVVYKALQDAAGWDTMEIFVRGDNQRRWLMDVLPKHIVVRDLNCNKTK